MSSDEPLLITGVARRVGLHLAHTFLDRGIPVIGTYRSQRPSLAELERKGAELYQCDFNDEAQTDALAQTIVNKHESLRAIIHNASDWLPETADLPGPEIMRRMMQVHVGAPYQLNLALEPLLMASQAEHTDIIHVGDYVSSRGSKNHIAYAASKAAGLPLGSGGIESANKFISHVRLKRSGAWWIVENGNAILRLRCAMYSGTFDRVFEKYRKESGHDRRSKGRIGPVIHGPGYDRFIAE